MRKIKANIWEVPAEVKVVPTNGMYTDVDRFTKYAHMGKGLAKQAVDRWPHLAYSLGWRLAKHGNYLYIFSVPADARMALGCPTLVTFPTKDDWHKPAKLDLITQSARELGEAGRQHGWSKVLLPPVGCGLGGLSWDTVEPILDQYLDHHFLVVDRE